MNPPGAVGSFIIGLLEDEGVASGPAEDTTALLLRHEGSGPWIQFEGCTKGETDTISVRAAAEVGCKAQAGDRLLVKIKSTDGTVAAGFNVLSVVAADFPPIQWAHKATWTKVVPRRPQGAALSSLREPIVSLELASEEWEDAWWAKQQLEMQARSLEEGTDRDEGGLLADERHRPDTAVLGPWMWGVMQPEGHEADYQKPPEGNPEWMNSKAMGSLFVAGGVHAPGMYEKWKAAGASAQVLRWIKGGCYTNNSGG